MTPQVPDLLNRTTSNFNNVQVNQGGSQDSGLGHHHLQLQQPAKLSAHELALYSVGADDNFPPPPSPLVTPKSPSKDGKKCELIQYNFPVILVYM